MSVLFWKIVGLETRYGMKKHLTLLLLLGSFIFCTNLIASCGQDKSFFTIDGKIAGMHDQLVVLEKRTINDATVVDTITSNENGEFHLKGIFTEPALYTLNINNHTLPIVVDNNKISISADYNNLDNYVVNNSPATKNLIDFSKQYELMNEDKTALKLVMDSLNEHSGPDSLKLELQRKGDAIDKKIDDYVKQYADNSKSFPLVYYITSLYLDPYDDADYFKNMAASLQGRFSNQPLAVAFSNLIKRKQQEEDAKPIGPQVGDTAIDFTLMSDNGKKVSLSSFEGKYVLLDFWASWCPPCRGQNIYVVAAHNQFKDQNFTVLSVSLDNNKDEWAKAIQEDRLSWTNVSDLNKWKSDVVRVYSVRSIPANFLISPEGKIIAKDLTGDDISAYLSKTLP